MVIESRLKIPKSRIGVVIGKKGIIKSEIESITGVSLQIDSEDGSVHISAISDTPEDPTLVLKARDIINAIGKGFSAEKAFYLLDDDIYLETIELGGSKNTIKRIKSRIIGEKGKVRRMIEASTEVLLSIFGNQVSIIGEISEIRSAREAIKQLVHGSKHSTVYRYLEQIRFRSKQEPPRIWKKRHPDEN
ncbi:MAG: KH domain-containing protein [Candidatus Hodarchaeales archaeon]|jgi:ribosomal RNA assembly protein